MASYCFLENYGIKHGNIKLSNIFKDSKGKVKFSDIGGVFEESNKILGEKEKAES